MHNIEYGNVSVVYLPHALLCNTSSVRRMAHSFLTNIVINYVNHFNSIHLITFAISTFPRGSHFTLA